LANKSFQARKSKSLIKNKVRLVIGILLVGFLIFNWISGRDGKTLEGRVISVHDGDTVTLLRDRASHKIRLDGIDCPELGQAFGKNARQFSADLAFDKQVTVYYHEKDRYQRYLGTVITPGGQNLNRELLKAGLAWHYKDYNSDPILAGLEIQARREIRGLWSDPRPIPPWEYRRGRRE